jgi:V/A-type H+/Na+-transporting ATPase subunit I
MFKPVPMAKVAVVGPKSQLAATIETLHRLRLLHIEDYAQEDDAFDLGTPLPEGSKISERLLRVRGVMKSAAMMPPTEARPFTTENLHALDSKLKEVEDDLIQLAEARDKARDRAKDLQDRRVVLDRVRGLSVPTRLLGGYQSLVTATGFVDPDADLAPLRAVSPDLEILESDEADGRFLAVFAPREAERALTDALGKIGFQAIELPALDGKPAQEVERLATEIAALKAEEARLEEKIANVRERHAAAFFALDEHLSIEADKTTAPVRFRTTEHSFMVEGWIPAGEFARLEQSLARATHNSVYTTRIQRASRAATHGASHEHSEHHGEDVKEEVVPVMLKNPSRSGPYELLTDTYSRPKYTELDPTLFMYIGFPVFFGMMLGDMGYALVILLMLGTGVFNKLYKIFGFQSQWHLNRIFLHCAIATLAFGALYTEFFGMELFGHHGIISHYSTHLGPIPFPLARLEYVKLLLALSLLVGVIHLFIGLVLGVRNAAAEHGFADAIKHRGSWLFILMAVFLAGVAIVPDTLQLGAGAEEDTASKAGVDPNVVNTHATETHATYHPIITNPAPLYYAALAFFAVGVVLLVMGEGGIALLELPTVLSNLLSYTRLVAIGLSGVGIALAGNKVGAGLMSGEILGLPAAAGMAFGILVVVLFHTMGVLLGILGPSLHALRLHYVEFFTKFYSGGGTAYSPFGAQRKYTKQEVKQA